MLASEMQVGKVYVASGARVKKVACSRDFQQEGFVLVLAEDGEYWRLPHHLTVEERG